MHDASILKRAGHDIGRSIAEKRKDMVYLGPDNALVMLTPNCSMLLTHPWAGSAYSISYRPQKMIEAMSGGEKPNILVIGHFHKAEYLFYRNVHTFQAGCFLGGTTILMSNGEKKKIKNVSVGDEVITHTGEVKKVTEVFERPYCGDFYKLNYGRKGRLDQTITATEEHPFLIERDGKRQWLEIKNVKENDFVFVVSKKCECCGASIPYYHKLCKNCNPMDKAEVREKLSEARGGFRKSRSEISSGIKHLEKDIIPFCEEKQKDGWKIVPIGAGVIPDAVGFKDGKIVLFEVESSKYGLLEFKKAKYEGALISNYVDGVEWVDVSKKRVEQGRSEYEYDAETGLCKVRVLSLEKNNSVYNNPKSLNDGLSSFISVYNIEVEDNHSYIANRVAVHNCMQAQTPFMRGKSLAAMLGGWIVEVEVNLDGTISKIKQEYIPYYTAIKDDWKNWR